MRDTRGHLENVMTRRGAVLFGIVVGGLIAGCFDITYAVVFSSLRGVPAIRVLQSVASGLLGRAAYDGGGATAALGLLLHFSIALIWAALFAAVAARVEFAYERPARAGLLWGAVIYAVMYYVVIPLSRVPRKPRFDPFLLAMNLLIHTFFIGLPIAIAAARARAAEARP